MQIKYDTERNIKFELNLKKDVFLENYLLPHLFLLHVCTTFVTFDQQQLTLLTMLLDIEKGNIDYENQFLQ